MDTVTAPRTVTRIMGSMSFFHWLVVLNFLFPVMVIIPVAKILARVGWSRWWSLVFLLPLANCIVVWMFAFGHWRAAPSLKPS
jgi:ABC-type glycerol-3-phosphate transport system permease component